MDDRDKINAVDRMQKYILSHIDDEITMKDLSLAAGYSLWHSARIFKEISDQTPFEFIRAIRLTAAAKELRDENTNVVDVAFDNGFNSHDGFTRAFTKRFNITPKKYRDEKPPLSYFTYYPIHDYYLYINQRNGEKMKDIFPNTVTVQAEERPVRKLIFLHSKKATDYFSYCEENGCDWEGLLNSISEKFDSAAILELPKDLVQSDSSSIAAGIEVPADYSKSLPDGYAMIELPSCTMLYFRGMPYENEGDFCKAIDVVFEAIENYKPELYGYSFADDIAPKFNFGASGKNGAKMAVPVRSL